MSTSWWRAGPAPGGRAVAAFSGAEQPPLPPPAAGARHDRSRRRCQPSEMMTDCTRRGISDQDEVTIRPTRPVRRGRGSRNSTPSNRRLENHSITASRRPRSILVTNGVIASATDRRVGRSPTACRPYRSPELERTGSFGRVVLQPLMSPRPPHLRRTSSSRVRLSRWFAEIRRSHTGGGATRPSANRHRDNAINPRV